MAPHCRKFNAVLYSFVLFVVRVFLVLTHCITLWWLVLEFTSDDVVFGRKQIVFVTVSLHHLRLSDFAMVADCSRLRTNLHVELTML